MKFFVPQAAVKETEAVYAEALDALKKQLRWPITPRRIRRMSYMHDKRHHTLEVGQLDDQETRFVVLAIFESSQYIAYTRTPEGRPGVIILVSPEDVTEIEDFDAELSAP